MKFERITADEIGSARNAGYSFDPKAAPVVDLTLSMTLIAERGEEYVDAHIDGLMDFESAAYSGDDGNAYAVEFVAVFDRGRCEMKPLAWHRLIEPKPEPKHITVKIFDGCQVIVNDEVTKYECMNDAYDYLRIQEEFRTDITRHLYGFGSIDLTAAYRGHYYLVRIDLIPCKD